MEYLFEYQDGYDVKEHKLMNRLYVRIKPLRRLGIVLLRLLFAALGLLMIALGVFRLTGVFTSTSTVFSVFILLYGLVILLLAIFYFSYSARRSKRMTLRIGGPLALTLGETCITSKLTGAESFYEYAAVKSVYYWKGNWFLFVDDRHAMLLALRALKSGDAAALPAFLREKTGQEIRYLDKKEKIIENI